MRFNAKLARRIGAKIRQGDPRCRQRAITRVCKTGGFARLGETRRQIGVSQMFSLSISAEARPRVSGSGSRLEPEMRQSKKLEHFPPKWLPLRRRKCGNSKELERLSDSFQSESALSRTRCCIGLAFVRFRIARDRQRLKPFDDRALVHAVAEARFRLGQRVVGGGEQR
jgi:hypothetical protein